MEEFENPEEQLNEITKNDLIECPNCKSLNKVVFETLRVTGTNKVKSTEVMGCMDCGTIFSDVNKLKDII
jgi:hypothetical protein